MVDSCRFNHAERGMTRFPPNIEQVTIDVQPTRAWLNVRRNETDLSFPMTAEDCRHLAELLKVAAEALPAPGGASPPAKKDKNTMGFVFHNFSVGSLKELIGTGQTGERLDGEAVVLAVQFDQDEIPLFAWMCFTCGAIHALTPKHAAGIGETPVVFANPCTARNAPPLIAVRLRPAGEAAPRLGDWGW